MRAYAKIDSEQLSIPLDSGIDLEEVERKAWYKIKSENKKGNAEVIYHTSRECGRYNAERTTYKKQMEKKKEKLKEVGVTMLKSVKVTRVDVCFDFDTEFMEMFKLNDCIRGLYRLEYKERDSSTILSERLRKATSMMVNTRHNELYIYDKAHESMGNHLYKTRIEFRYKDIRVDEKTKLQDLIKLLDGVIGNFEAFEKQRIKDLYEWYKEDEEKGVVHSFSEFVRHNEGYITTSAICKGLYELVGMKSRYDRWLTEYKKVNDIEFATKTDVKKLLAELKRALKEYIKG